MSTLRRAGVVLAAALVATALAAAPASAGEFDEPSGAPPASTAAPQEATANPAPTRTCRLYGSSAGFGMLCSDAAAGRTLAEVLRDGGVDVTKAFCWDDPELPDGFQPERQVEGPGRWWLHTCLNFDGPVVRTNAVLTYEFHFHEPGEEITLTDEQQAAIDLVTGRGQIPFLQVQTTPISSPRVDQDVAFSMLCDSKVVCADTAEGRTVETPRLVVGGVTMWAELVHLRVLPEGAARPGVEVNCRGAGLPRTAAQLDAGPDDDPRVCRHRYERSSNEAGAGTRGDRYAARVTAYWQIWFDDGAGPERLGLPYEKTTVNLIRVTEVQTLVVS